jgi:hypothetical protein
MRHKRSINEIRRLTTAAAHRRHNEAAAADPSNAGRLHQSRNTLATDADAHPR